VQFRSQKATGGSKFGYISYLTAGHQNNWDKS